MKKTTKTTSFKAALAAGAMIAAGGTAYAATQGTLGTLNSQGDINLTATIGDLIQISALNDITFIAPAQTAGEAFCVYRNGLAGTYSVALDSANGLAAGDYDLLVAGNRIGYTVDWDDDTDASVGGTSIVEGAAAAGSFVGHTTDTTCGGGDNASIFVTLNATEYIAAPAGVYVDVLTMTVTPI